MKSPVQQAMEYEKAYIQRMEIFPYIDFVKR